MAQMPQPFFKHAFKGNANIQSYGHQFEASGEQIYAGADNGFINHDLSVIPSIILELPQFAHKIYFHVLVALSELSICMSATA